jgi:hypothetical protein
MSKDNGEVKKYLRNGAISPMWAMLQCRQDQEDHEIEFVKRLADATRGCNMSVTKCLPFNCTIASIGNNSDDDYDYDDYDDYDDDISVEEDLQAQFDFLKSHSDNPEDLELAKIILQLYNQ